MLISNFPLKIFNMDIYCCCLQKYVNELMEIRNEPRSQLPTGIIGTVFPRISAAALIVFVDQICPEIFLKNPENNILVGSNNSQLQYTYRSCQNQSNFTPVCN